MALLLALGCNTSPALDPLAARGREVYLAHCTACHNPDPSRIGPVGPAVKGSSRVLLEARVMRAAYPEGYTPKRTTHTMVALPDLAPELDALAAFLH